jgi:uroporphyrinogen-III synthase
VAAIGPATAEALTAMGVFADVIPEKFVGEALAAALQERIGDTKLRGARILLLRADSARPVLREELMAAGAVVEDLAVYRTVMPGALPGEVVEAIGKGEIDWVTFTSASTAMNLHALLSEELRGKVAGMKKLSIGPITSAALEKLGWKPEREAQRHDIAGMVEALQAGA